MRCVRLYRISFSITQTSWVNKRIRYQQPVKCGLLGKVSVNFWSTFLIDLSLRIVFQIVCGCGAKKWHCKIKNGSKVRFNTWSHNQKIRFPKSVVGNQTSFSAFEVPVKESGSKKALTQTSLKSQFRFHSNFMPNLFLLISHFTSSTCFSLDG